MPERCIATKRKCALAFISVFAFILAGCAQTPQPGTSQTTATPNAQTQNNFQTKVDSFTTIGQGTAIGATAGGLIGFVAGGQSVQSTALGAGAGAIVGAGIGALVAKAQNSFASREDRLNRLIADAKKKNDDLSTMLIASQQHLQEEKQEVVALKAKMAKTVALTDKDKQDLAQLKSDTALYDKAVHSTDDRLAELNEELADYRKIYPSDDVKTIEASITSYKNKRLQLVQNRDEYIKLAESVGPGGKS